MLTPEQETWISHLSATDTITVLPFDPTADATFQKIKQLIQSSFGAITVLHLGASSLGISGQDEIDVYIPVVPDQFDAFIPRLQELFGKPRSLYALERARFVTSVNRKHIDIFLINQESTAWQNSVTFTTYLRSNPDVLDAYRQLKEDGNGLSVRDYYRRKIEFINAILEKTK